MKKKLKIIIPIIIIIIMLAIGGYFAHNYFYNHSEKYHIRFKYGKEVAVDKYEFKNTINSIFSPVVEDDYIKNTEAYPHLVVPKSGETREPKYLKNGFLNLKIYFENNKAYIEITSAIDSDGNNYTDTIEKTKFNIYTEGNIPKYVYYDNENIYILTQEGHLYYYIFPHDRATIDVEDTLDFLSLSAIEYYIGEEERTENGNTFITKVGGIYENFAIKNGNVYGIGNDKTITNLTNNTTAIPGYSIRGLFSNTQISVSIDGTVEYCHSGFIYDTNNSKEKECKTQETKKTIVNENNKEIKVSFVVETSNKAYFVDDNRNIYYTDYNDENSLPTVKLLTDAKVKNVNYVYKPSEPYMLEGIFIVLEDNSIVTLVDEEISRLNIYNINEPTIKD